MIRKIFVIAFPQLLALLLILSTMTVRDYIKFVLGIDETNLITIVFVLYGLIIVLFQFARPYSKYALSVFIFFILHTPLFFYVHIFTFYAEN